MLWLFALAVATATTVVAQRPQRNEGDGGPRRFRDERGPRGSAPMQKSIGLMFLHWLRTELELSDDTALKLLPHLDRIETIRRESAGRREQIADDLRRMYRAPSVTNDEVLARIKALDAEEVRARGELDRERDLMLQFLDPHQKAGFVVFANRLRERLERMHSQPGPPGGDRLPNGDRPRDEPKD